MGGTSAITAYFTWVGSTKTKLVNGPTFVLYYVLDYVALFNWQ
jgi:hypothetical protein